MRPRANRACGLWSGVLLASWTVLAFSGLISAAALAAKPNKKAKSSRQKSCQVWTVSPAGKLVDSLPALDSLAAPEETAGFDQMVESVATAIRKGDSESLAALFHPRLDMTAPVIASQLAEIRSRYVEPVEILPLKLLWLDTVDGDPGAIPCDYDGITLNPLYGYSHQASFLFQASGQLDIARIMIALVPVPPRTGNDTGNSQANRKTTPTWKIGSFHSQQWTHGAKDPLAWIETARITLKQKYPYAAWVQFDVAEKLLRANSIASYAAHDAVVAERDAIMPLNSWLTETRKHSGGLALEDAVSLLVPRGAGVLFKLRLVKELSTVEIQTHCKAVVNSLTQNHLAEGLSGIRCAYYRPGESLAKDSVTGGLFIPF